MYVTANGVTVFLGGESDKWKVMIFMFCSTQNWLKKGTVLECSCVPQSCSLVCWKVLIIDIRTDTSN